MRPFLAALALGSALAFSTSSAAAQTLPSVDSIVASLAPTADGPMVRSMRQAGPIPMNAAQMIPAGFDFATFSLSVGFDEGSHLLNAAGMTSLRTLAAALLDPKLQGSRFQVGAHVGTDASVNSLPLTSRRAQTVVTHLVTFYNIPEERLIPVGYGNSKLRDVAVPTSPANERIELINVDALQ